MRFSTLALCCTVLPAIHLLAHPLKAQQSAPSGVLSPATDDLPDSPTPQMGGVEPAESQTAQPQGNPQTSSQSSLSSAPSQQQSTQQSQHDKAEQELKQQETQRVAGIMAAFNTTRNPEATPLSPDQKFRLFFRSAFDPWPFSLTAVVAGIGQAQDSNPEWGGGMQGYAKRFGAGYSDYFLGNFFGNAVLPSLLHEDPRYFQKGTGNPIKRILWAAASTGWCKRDNGKWGPNYANIGGNLIGSAIGRLYYPASARTVSQTFSDGLTVSAEGIVGAELIEFWPDVVRHHREKEAEKRAHTIDAAKRQSKESKPSGQNQN